MISWKDWKTKKIPDRYILILFSVGVIGIWFVSEVHMMERIIGLFCISIPLLLLAGVVPGSIGGGDIKLMAAGGFLLGMHRIWNAFATGVISAGIYVFLLLILKKVKRNSEIALGPFLCIGIISELLKI